MTYYYIYQITNLVNNKIYIGVHKTSKLDDGYMGSGKIINSAIEKYSIDNFKKDILEFFETSDAMYAKEKEVVTDEFLLREDTYNLRRGGTGGFDYINKSGIPKMLGKKHTAETKAKQGHIHSIEERKQTSARMIGNDYNPTLKLKGPDHPGFAKPKSQAHKEKLRESNLGVKQQIVTCPHCGKEGGERAIKRWHKNCGIRKMVLP